MRRLHPRGSPVRNVRKSEHRCAHHVLYGVRVRRHEHFFLYCTHEHKAVSFLLPLPFLVGPWGLAEKNLSFTLKTAVKRDTFPFLLAFAFYYSLKINYSSSKTNPVYGRSVNSFVLVCSLSSHRHLFIPLIALSIHNKQTTVPFLPQMWKYERRSRSRDGYLYPYLTVSSSTWVQSRCEWIFRHFGSS